LGGTSTITPPRTRAESLEPFVDQLTTWYTGPVTEEHDKARHIVAMGGGGFSMEPDNPLLDDFVLSLSRQQPAKICFIPTASGDSANYLVKFYRAFSGRAVPSDLTLFDSTQLPRSPPRTADLEQLLLEQDVVYVGGGSTVNLLALWRAHGLDAILRRAWEQGVVLSGVSAGMICWFETSLTDSFGALAPLRDGLGFLGGSACPHYDSEPQRRPRYHELILSGFPAGIGVDDGAALHFVGDTLAEVVSSRPKAAAFRVVASEGAVREERLPVRYLGTGSDDMARGA
jgi:dipeptidase E